MTSAHDVSDEFPGDKKRKSVVGKHDQRHAGEKRRVKGQYAARRWLVTAVAERENACGRGAEIDHDQEESRERVEPEMRAEPGQTDRQSEVLGFSASKKMRERGDKRNGRDYNDR